MSITFESLKQVQTPKWIYSLASLMLIGTFLANISLIFVPWQQTVMGTGRITAFSPNNRPQQIESPIKGRIKKWHVKEGDQVKAGDLIVELQDLEKDFLPPEVIELTQSSRSALAQNQQAYLSKADSVQDSIDNLQDNLNDSLNSAQQSLRVAQTDLKTAKLNLQRTLTLASKGLSSERDKELAIQSERKAEGDLRKAEIELEKIRSKTLSEITKLQSEKASSLAEAAKAADEMAKADLKLSTAKVRKEISLVKSPRDGIVVRLYKRGPGETFKENEAIAIITPQTQDQAVELFVKDIDAPLISVNKPVRLQFSGWPALQFAGFSNSVHIGTFGGKVAVVDNVDFGGGKYRILVVPDPDQPAWPSADYLRPGTQAAGWIILKTVPLGYELWRRFNGFPIALPDINQKEKGKNDYDDYSSSPEENTTGKGADIIYKRKSK